MSLLVPEACVKGQQRTIAWSYGGGVQSAAIGVLVATGRLPRPDVAVIADTGREASTTWQYLDMVMAPFVWLNAKLRIERAPHDLASVDLYAKNDDLLIPAYTNTGALRTFCSVEWKRRVVARWLRARGVRECDLWLGISADELQRARVGGDPTWMQPVYPLLTMLRPALSRADCEAVVRDAGLPVPPKSACWMCPYRSDAEWRALSAADFTKAVSLEEDIRARDPGVFLHRARRPLGEIDLTPKESPQVDLFCESGFCWT